MGLIISPYSDINPNAVSLYAKLVSWYTFDNTIDDAHGPNDLTNASSFGEPVNYQTGVFNECTRMRRNGSIYSDYLRDSTPSGLSSGAFTIGGLFRMQELTNDVSMFMVGASGSSDGAQCEYASNAINWKVTVLGIDVFTRSSAATSGVWYQMILTRDGSNNCSAYLAGSLVGAAAVGAGAIDITGIRMVKGDANAPMFDADECFICDEALTADEVSYLYNNGAYKSYDDVKADSGN